MKPMQSRSTAKSAAKRPCVLYVEDDDQNWEQGGSQVITKPVDFTKLSLALARACLTELDMIVTRGGHSDR
ncbi:MAG: hypothetical protein ACKVPX_18340 [Myxococcaceae bacterium]